MISVMKNSLSWYIGLRYTRSKHRNKFVSFISLASVIGIALGVAVLITVLSVFNGFDEEFQKSIFAYIPQVTITTGQDMTKNWQALATKTAAVAGVTSAAPFVQGEAIVSQDSLTQGLQIFGIEPKQEQKISKFSTKIVEGKYDSLNPGQFNMLIGSDLANRLGTRIGDKIVLYLPQQMNISPVGPNIRLKRFTVSGIFHVSNSLGPYNSAVAFINLTDASKLFPVGFGTRGLNLKIANIYNARAIEQQLYNTLPNGYAVSTWMDALGAFSQALGIQKTMMMIILMLIVAVAAFNLVSSLVMAVNEKQADIAILRTLGMRPKTVMSIFIVQGFVLGLIGVLIGLVLGVLMALNVTHFVSWLQGVLHMQLVSDSVYIVNFLPSKISISDLITVTLAALGMSLVATLYPAWKAFRLQPAEALRYE